GRRKRRLRKKESRLHRNETWWSERWSPIPVSESYRRSCQSHARLFANHRPRVPFRPPWVDHASPPQDWGPRDELGHTHADAKPSASSLGRTVAGGRT